MTLKWLAVATMALVVGCALVVGLGTLISSGQLMHRSGGQIIFLCAAGISAPVLAGWILRRHPTEWTGPLVGACVIAADLAACRTAPLGAMTPVTGLVSLTLVLLPTVLATRHPALSGPRGLRGARRAVGTCFWLTVMLGPVIAIGAWRAHTVPTSWWFVASPRPIAWWLIALQIGHTVIVAVGVAVCMVAILVEYRSNSATGRFVLRPLVFPAVGWVVATLVAGVWIATLEIVAPTADLRYATTNVVVFLPAVLVSVLAGGAAWIDLMVRHPRSTSPAGTAPDGHGLQEPHDHDVGHFLSRALADPTVRVLYPANYADKQWIDAWGRPATVDVDRSDRGVTVLCRGEKIIGLIELDAATMARPDAVELVATAAGLRMETESLLASARSDLERSRLLASRLMSAVDAPRAALRRELLDGPLMELDTIASDLAGGLPMQDAADRLSAITAELRTISHGVFPPSLTTDGLAGAINRAGTPHRRFPAAVEMTAYLAMAADPNSALDLLHTDAGSMLTMSTSVAPESSLLDRLSALDGAAVRSGAHWLISIPIGG
jgi:hypothetical protein